MSHGIKWLTEHLNEACETAYTPRQIRIFLRRLAQDGVVKAKEPNARWAFSDEDDPLVKSVKEYVTSGNAARDNRKEIKKLKDQKQEEDLDDLDELLA